MLILYHAPTIHPCCRLVCKLLWFNADTRASLASRFNTDIEQITSSAVITQACLDTIRCIYVYTT